MLPRLSPVRAVSSRRREPGDRTPVPVPGTIFRDTLFRGGPGATGRSYSDADLIVASIRAKLFALPGDTVVHTGHGDDTTIAAEQAAS